MANSPNRSTNWIEHSERALTSKYPWIAERAINLNERMTCLLLERLPPNLAQDLLNLLPRRELNRLHFKILQRGAIADSDPSIGFPDFMELASQISGFENLSNNERGIIARDIADSFLWAVTQELPPELKESFARVLPTELKARMNLYSSGSEESKVA